MKQRSLIYGFSLLVLLPLVYVFGTGIMEARNLISAQSMALDGDWLIPHLYTEIRLNKPPLPVWLTVPVFMLDGSPSMLALHLPAILVTGLLGVFCYELYRTLFLDEKAAFYAGLVISSMLLTLKLGTTNSWDIYSVVFMTGALLSLMRPGRGWLYAGILFMAASILSKGPVQLYTMLLPFLATMLLFRKPVPWKRLAIILIGGCLLGSLWYTYVYLAVPHVAATVAQGEVTAWSNRHTASFFFYLSFPAFAGAWFLPSLAGLGSRWLSKRASNRPAMTFLICWFLISLLLLSLVPEKKERYLMPAMVPLALLCAAVLRHWADSLAQGTLNRLERGIITAHFSLGTLAAVGLCLFIGWSHRAYLLYTLCFALLCVGLGLVGSKNRHASSRCPVSWFCAWFLPLFVWEIPALLSKKSLRPVHWRNCAPCHNFNRCPAIPLTTSALQKSGKLAKTSHGLLHFLKCLKNSFFYLTRIPRHLPSWKKTNPLYMYWNVSLYRQAVTAT